MKPDFGNPLTRPRGEYSLRVEQVPGDDQVWVVWLLPSNEQLKSRGFALDETNASPCVVMTLDARNARFMIHPFYTAPNEDGSYTEKYPWLIGIDFDWDDPTTSPDEHTVHSLLESQPSEFIITLDYGLGIKQGYRAVMRALRDLTDAKVIYIGDKDAIAGEFKVDRQKFGQICAEVKRIDSRAKKAENEVKDTTVFNALAESAGKKARPFRLGRNEIRQLIQDFAADPDYRDPKAQKVLVTEIGKAARRIATQAHEATDKLVSDLQLSRLEGAVDEFSLRLGQNQSETEWQKFFEADPFLLSFAFGYPISLVNGQTYVGGRRIDGKGEKISDFLVKNSISSNAALIEIKKPATPLLKPSPYRDRVFAPHDELSGGITQVLDQRYHFVANFSQHLKDNEWWGEHALADFDVDCVLIAGTMPNDKDQRRSFQLFRKNSHGVRIFTFDEVFRQLEQILGYLKASDE